MMWWGLIYDVLAVLLVVALTIIVYQIFIISKRTQGGVARTS